ncbi:MAG: HNH endonuclease [Verrucomicrobia bacterium]|nr:HNH endonuclease [Verrucomicrobiota bacterium]
MNRAEFFNKLNAKLRNPYWSWCSLHPDRRFAVFTLWADLIVENKTTLTSDDTEVLNRLGGQEQERVIDYVIEHNIPAFGVICHAKDVNADPRKIDHFESEYLNRLTVTRENGRGVVTHQKRIHVLDVIALGKTDRSESVFDDLGQNVPEGHQTPDRATQVVSTIKRDPKVREFVLMRAKGSCEYCGCEGFLMINGNRYVEAHHIIALGNNGPDTTDNVIALCPMHHRQAHFGADAEKLESKFMLVLKSKTGNNAGRSDYS